MSCWVLDDLVIEKAYLSVVLLDVVFDLAMQALVVVEAVFLAVAVARLSSVHLSLLPIKYGSVI